MIIIDFFSLTFCFIYQRDWIKDLVNLYKTFIISYLLAKLYGIILENKICILLESQEKRIEAQAHFRNYGSNANYLITFIIVA